MDIHIQNLEATWAHSGNKIFHLPSLQIPYRQKVLLQGPSGIGKTSFLHMLAGLLSFQKGHIQIGDFQLEKMSDSEKSSFRYKNVGIIFQRLNLFDHLTCRENLELAPCSNSVPNQDKLLRSLQIEELLDRRSSHLSLGQQQRVAVARVLRQSPSLILADEPTSSLDDHNTKAVMEGIMEGCSQSTFLCVSHDARIQSYFDVILDFRKVIRL